MTSRKKIRSFLSNARGLHAAVLATPFAVVIAASSGLTRVLPVFQIHDEAVHYQIVLAAARTWPRPVLNGYGSWSGPLVYWLLAGLSRPFGTSLVSVRFAVAIMSWLACLTAYVIFRDRLGARPWVALALALLLAISPWFFLGESFYVMTDNPTWLFIALALERLLAYVEHPRISRLAAFAVFAAAATLMRQVAVWVFLPALAAWGYVRVPPRDRFWSAVVLLLGLIPLVALLVSWGGFLPAGGVQAEPGLYRFRNLCLSLATVGLWGLLLVPAEEIRELPARLMRRGGALIAGATAAGLVAVDLGAMANLRDYAYEIGVFSPVTVIWWRIQGTNFFWWIFVPLGAATLAALLVTRWQRLPDRVLVVALLAVVLSSVANMFWYERYVDFAVLLALCGLVAAGGARIQRVDVLRWGGIAGISICWIFFQVRT